VKQVRWRARARPQGQVVKSWKRRHFVLTQSELRYFERAGGELRGSLRLADVREIREAEGPSFALQLVSGRVFTMQAATRQERDDWMGAIRKALFRPSEITRVLREITAQ
jgi:hypothetical protein